MKWVRVAFIREICTAGCMNCRRVRLPSVDVRAVAPFDAFVRWSRFEGAKKALAQIRAVIRLFDQSESLCPQAHVHERRRRESEP